MTVADVVVVAEFLKDLADLLENNVKSLTMG